MTLWTKGNVSQLNEMASTGFSGDDKQKWFYVKEGLAAQVIVVTRSLAEVMYGYLHTVYVPNLKDKKVMGLRIACLNNAADVNGQICPICAEQLMNDWIQKTLYVMLTVLDRRTFTVEGKTWGDTIYPWALKKNQMLHLAEIVKTIRPDLSIRGLQFHVSKQSKNTNISALPQVFTEAQLQEYMLRSPRTEWQRKKMSEAAGRSVSPQEAAQEYFKEQDYQSMVGPTPERSQRFVMHVRALQDRLGQQQTQSTGFDFPPQTSFSQSQEVAPFAQSQQQQQFSQPFAQPQQFSQPFAPPQQMPIIQPQPMTQQPIQQPTAQYNPAPLPPYGDESMWLRAEGSVETSSVPPAVASVPAAPAPAPAPAAPAALVAAAPVAAPAPAAPAALVAAAPVVAPAPAAPVAAAPVAAPAPAAPAAPVAAAVLAIGDLSEPNSKTGVDKVDPPAIAVKKKSKATMLAVEKEVKKKAIQPSDFEAYMT